MATPRSRLIGRGNAVVVEAYGEVLLMPGGSVHRWNEKFKGAVKRHTRAAAPHNKRPRWAHYGPVALRDSFRTTKTRFYKTNAGGNLYAAVASTAPYSAYVDQGTGIYNGSGPWQAAILPPWRVGGASLYEATWRPSLDPSVRGPRKVAPVWIRGQEGQYFFTTGLERAFHSMRLNRGAFVSPYKVLTTLNNPTITRAANFVGNTPNTAGFRAQLALWRQWRDEAWGEFRPLGRAGGLNRRLQGRLRDRVRGGFDRDRLAKAAAARRARENEAVRAQRERKALSEQRRLAAEEAENQKVRERIARNKLRDGNRRAEREAKEFFAAIKKAYPDAVIASNPNILGDGRVLWQVKYTLADGEVVRESWAYGVDD